MVDEIGTIDVTLETIVGGNDVVADGAPKGLPVIPALGMVAVDGTPGTGATVIGLVTRFGAIVTVDDAGAFVIIEPPDIGLDVTPIPMLGAMDGDIWTVFVVELFPVIDCQMAVALVAFRRVFNTFVTFGTPFTTLLALLLILFTTSLKTPCGTRVVDEFW
jgi:hypothetical protein